MKVFKGTFVASGSALDAAIQHDDKERSAGRDPRRKVVTEDGKTTMMPSLSDQTYADTTKRYEGMYSEADRLWFSAHQKVAIANAKINPKAY